MAKLKILWIFLKVKFAMLFKKSIVVKFKLIDHSWYCDIPGWPKEYFPNSLMVGEASALLFDLYELSDTKDEISLRVYTKEVANKNVQTLYKTSSSLTGGGYYQYDDIYYHIWLCPVTLFVLGKYPDTICFTVEKTKRKS